MQLVLQQIILLAQIDCQTLKWKNVNTPIQFLASSHTHPETELQGKPASVVAGTCLKCGKGPCREASEHFWNMGGFKFHAPKLHEKFRSKDMFHYILGICRLIKGILIFFLFEQPPFVTGLVDKHGFLSIWRDLKEYID